MYKISQTDLKGANKKTRIKIAKVLNKINFRRLIVDIVNEQLRNGEMPVHKTKAYKNFRENGASD